VARKRTVRLFAGITALAGLLAAGPVQAQSSAQVDAIEHQIQQLQRELAQVKRELAARDAQVRAAQAEAARAQLRAQQAQEEVERIPVIPPYAPPPPPPPGQMYGLVPGQPAIPSMGSSSPALITQVEPRPVFQVGWVTVKLGGFAALESYYRNPEIITSVGSNFSGIPLNNDVRAHQGNLMFTSQQSRVAALVEGVPDSVTKVLTYVEADFLGAAPTANNNESNSYTPRLRQFFGEYDRSDWGFHLNFGQMWSMATLYKEGLIPRQENIPLTIDAQYNVGFTWKRTPSINLVKEFDDHKIWLGLSLENPQTVYSVGPNGAVPQATGETVTTGFLGVSQLDTSATYSSNIAPDVVLKTAFDPGWGHYELFGLARIMKDNVAVTGLSVNKTAWAGGVGGGFILPLFNNTVQLQGSALYGPGIGAYGSGQLPDATVGVFGEPVPITAVQALVGLVGHPTPNIDLYGYLGTEQAQSQSFEAGGKGFGYGSPLYSNLGCDVVLSTLSCIGDTRGLTEGTVGYWWRWLTGRWGTMALGTQYSFVRKSVFEGIGGSPTQNQQILMLSLRAYPFQ
jgi:outer membrane murein-binding lipoprotein Lpp